jgi:hypothetical protein
MGGDRAPPSKGTSRRAAIGVRWSLSHFRCGSGKAAGMPPLPAPGSPAAKRRQARFEFLILSAFAVAFFGMALALGTEPRMHLERTEPHAFRVTGSNHYFGHQFYSKTIEGVDSVDLRNSYRGRREDSLKERQRQMKQIRLVFEGADGTRLSWSRTEDSRMIDDFMRGEEPTLSLAAPPPWWRAALTWLCLGLGGLIFFRAVQSFFPKPSAWD